MNNPHLDIKDIYVTKNGNGSHKVKVSYSDQSHLDHDETNCPYRPRTKQERDVEREQQKITRAANRIAEIQKGPKPEGKPDQPPRDRRPAGDFLKALLPNRQPQLPSKYRIPTTPGERKFRNISLGIIIGALMATVYILIKLS